MYTYLYIEIVLLTVQTLGGIDSSLHKGALLYASLRREWYYEVIITDILIDGESLNLECKEVFLLISI